MNNEYKDIKTELLFMNKQDYYTKYRPGYDKKIVDILSNNYGLNSNSIVTEYGAGTGKFLELMQPYVDTYYFVEPNTDMINEAKKNNTSSNIVFLNEKAEETSIPNNTVDFAFAVHSFHYFEKDLFKNELQRTLKENGYFGIIWYDYIDDGDSLSDDWGELISGIKGFKDNHNKMDDRLNIFKDGKFDEHEFRIDKYYTYEELLGLGLSISSTPMPNQGEEYLKFEEGIKEIFNKHQKDNKVKFVLKCNIQIGNVK